MTRLPDGIDHRQARATYASQRPPQPDGVWRALLWLQAYLVVAVVVNTLTGANYGFLREKPAMSSLIDHLGDWPYYILGLEAVALISFLLLNLPFIRQHRQAKIS